MTEKHTYLSFVIDEIAEKLKKQAELLRQNEAFIEKALEDDQFDKRVAAEIRVQELEKEQKWLLESFNDLQERFKGSTTNVRNIRTALNGNRTGRSVEEQASLVFAALREANPQHSLVKHDPKGE